MRPAGKPPAIPINHAQTVEYYLALPARLGSLG